MKFYIFFIKTCILLVSIGLLMAVFYTQGNEIVFFVLIFLLLLLLNDCLVYPTHDLYEDNIFVFHNFFRKRVMTQKDTLHIYSLPQFPYIMKKGFVLGFSKNRINPVFIWFDQFDSKRIKILSDNKE